MGPLDHFGIVHDGQIPYCCMYCSLVLITGLHTHAGTRVRVSQARVQVRNSEPVYQPIPVHMGLHVGLAFDSALDSIVGQQLRDN